MEMSDARIDESAGERGLDQRPPVMRVRDVNVETAKRRRQAGDETQSVSVRLAEFDDRHIGRVQPLRRFAAPFETNYDCPERRAVQAVREARDTTFQPAGMEAMHNVCDADW